MRFRPSQIITPYERAEPIARYRDRLPLGLAGNPEAQNQLDWIVVENPAGTRLEICARRPRS